MYLRKVLVQDIVSKRYDNQFETKILNDSSG